MMKILKILYYSALTFIGLLATFLIISVLPIKGNYKTMIVLSGSMEPKIHTGSVVVVKPENNYKVGDVITFGQSFKTKTPTTHRIFAIKNKNGLKTYTTKGDANDAPDQKPITQSEIIGRVLLSVPYFGYGVAAAQKPIGFLLIVVVPAVIIIYDEARKIKQEIADMKKRKRAEKDTNSRKNREIKRVSEKEKEEKKEEEKILK